RGFRKSETRRAFLRDQLERGADQGLFQVAVVVAALAAPLLGPAHVKGLYMTRRAPSTSACTAPWKPSRRALRCRMYGAADDVESGVDDRLQCAPRGAGARADRERMQRR